MVGPVQPISKDVFGHWAVVMTAALAAALLLAIPDIPGRGAPRALPPPSASYVLDGARSARSFVPPLMRCAPGDDLASVPLLVQPPAPPIPAEAKYVPLESIFPPAAPAADGENRPAAQGKEPSGT